jgi:4-hydroxy-tetrahydrodipicolinate synthase
MCCPSPSSSSSPSASRPGDVAARRRALELDNALAVLSSFDEGPDLVLFYKYLMVLEGNPEYAMHFNASDSLSPGQMHFARTQLELFKSWYAAWSAGAERCPPR